MHLSVQFVVYSHGWRVLLDRVARLAKDSSLRLLLVGGAAGRLELAEIVLYNPEGVVNRWIFLLLVTALRSFPLALTQHVLSPWTSTDRRVLNLLAEFLIRDTLHGLIVQLAHLAARLAVA